MNNNLIEMQYMLHYLAPAVTIKKVVSVTEMYDLCLGSYGTFNFLRADGNHYSTDKNVVDLLRKFLTKSYE